MISASRKQWLSEEEGVCHYPSPYRIFTEVWITGFTRSYRSRHLLCWFAIGELSHWQAAP